MSNSVYHKMASEIVHESIKSVVYIDEKAWNPFERKSYNKYIPEHIISKGLYTSFKKSGIGFSVHKFASGEEDLPLNDSLKRYLFENKDLILLDWDLVDGNHSNLPSLKLLANIIEQPHIHFCCIYSSSPDFDFIIKKICSYFSGISNEKFGLIKAIFDFNQDIIDIIKSIDITKEPENRLIGVINKIDPTILPSVKEITQKSYSKSLIDMAIAINKDLPKSDGANNYFSEIISNLGNEYTLLINNTIITILKKGKNQPASLIRNFIKLMAKNKSKSFLKLLGLNMQNEFTKKGAFVNPEILNISFESFLFHRSQMIKHGNISDFENFMKDVLIENAKLNLNNSKLALLKGDFLDKYNVSSKNKSKKEIALINSFYNGIKLKGDRDLFFGDIFQHDNNTYYLCITAVCDCITHEGESNIDFKYYFVKGSKLATLAEGFDKGDGGFISYIDDSTCISWSSGEYIKPFQLYVPDPQITDELLMTYDWKKDDIHKSKQLKYIFTLKQNYAQRIANHAFTHPIRVGVDFVKTSNN